MKAFADDKIYKLISKLKFVLDRVEIILGNGENPSYQHLLPPHYFFEGFFRRVQLKFRIGRQRVIISLQNNVFWAILYTGIILSVCLCVHVQNTSNFVSGTPPTVLLLLY